MMLRLRYPSLLLPLALLAACSGAGNDPQAPATASSVTSIASTRMQPAAADTTSGVPATGAPDSRITWGDLSSHVGQYLKQTELLTAGPISEQLHQLLGDQFDTLARSLEVAGPLQREGEVFYIVGNAAHEGGLNQAYVLLVPQQQAIEVGLWTGGELSTYAAAGTVIAKPQDVRTMIDNARQTRTPTASKAAMPSSSSVP